MSSIGLAHVAGGKGTRTSSILKSPLSASGTPVWVVLHKVKGVEASQIRVAADANRALGTSVIFFVYHH
jgi:hypothetical protein